MKSTRLTIHQGDDYKAFANVTQNGNPVDLTGVTGPTAQLRKDYADNDGTVDATFTCSIVLPSTIIMALSHTVTVGLASAAFNGCYFWDLQVTLPDGSIRTIAKGTAHILQEVTR